MVSSDQSVVQIARVTKVFKDFWHRARVSAVNKLDMEVFPHEVFGLLGPNGSGKSTTIKMILGLLYPTSGRIRVFDRPPTDVAIKSRIGFLPEESYLYPFLNARETLDYYGRLFRQARPERRRRIDMLLDMVGLSTMAYRRVGEYSKGMQRRIGLAQALINDPDLLILDEPTSGMDPLGTRQFKDLIAEFSRRGKTVILSSHLLADVEDVCDRVSILYGGAKRAEGGVNDLLSQQGLTQITSERLDDSTIEQIRQLIASAESKSVLEVSAPRDRLESLFLRIVEEAQTARVRTDGTVGTGKVAEFLRADAAPESLEIIEELVSAGRQEAAESPPEPEPPEPVAPEPARDVLDELTSPRAETPKQKSEEPEHQEQTPSPAEQADRDVIESLLSDDQQRKND